MAQMNTSAAISVASVEDANSTSQSIRDDESNLRNYTQIAEDTARIVASEMNTTRQVLVYLSI